MNDRAKWTTLGVVGLVLAGIVAIVLVTGGDDEGASSNELGSASDGSALESQESGSTSEGDDEDAPEVATKEGDLDPPGRVVSSGEPASVTMETSEGSFVIDLDTDRAPKTANSFAYLTEEGFYDGLGFHRIVPGFVIQGGDPLGDGTGGPGFKVVERPPRNLSYDPGVVAMARSGVEDPGTSGSQFFVVTGPGGESLPPEYALVGQVSEGLDVVEVIGDLGGDDEQPTKTVVIEKATLETG